MHAASMLGTASDIANLASTGHGYEGTDRIGRTPCHLAAIAGNLKNLKTLVDLGADFEVPLYIHSVNAFLCRCCAACR